MLPGLVSRIHKTPPAGTVLQLQSLEPPFGTGANKHTGTQFGQLNLFAEASVAIDGSKFKAVMAAIRAQAIAA